MPHHYYDGYFQDYGKACFPNADWRWFKAQAMAESNIEPLAVSPVGAVGVMQLMPGTSKEMAGILGVEDLPLMPHINIRMGVCYLKRCWDIWQAETGIERLRFAWGSYNAGPGNILKAQKVAVKNGLAPDRWVSIAQVLHQVTGHHAMETIGYVSQIERNFERLVKAEGKA